MSKVDSLVTVTSGYASQGQLNSNFDKITDAFENTLSLDGSTPNSMGANLDMDSHRIINVASPVNSGDAVNLGFITDIIQGELEGTITILGDEDLDMDDHKIINVEDPTADQDAATKKYVDDSIAAAALGLSGDLDMQGNKVVNLGVGVAATDAVCVGQLGGSAVLGVGQGLEASGGNIVVKLDGDTLTRGAGGLSVTCGDGLEDGTGVEVKLDGTTLSKSGAGLKVSDATIASLSPNLKGAMVKRITTAGSTFNSELYDTSGAWVIGSPNTFTVPAGFLYANISYVHTGASATASQVTLTKNGVTLFVTKNNTGAVIGSTGFIPVSDSDTFVLTPLNNLSIGDFYSIELKN